MGEIDHFVDGHGDQCYGLFFLLLRGWRDELPQVLSVADRSRKVYKIEDLRMLLRKLCSDSAGNSSIPLEAEFRFAFDCRQQLYDRKFQEPELFWQASFGSSRMFYLAADGNAWYVLWRNERAYACIFDLCAECLWRIYNPFFAALLFLLYAGEAVSVLPYFQYVGRVFLPDDLYRQSGCFSEKCISGDDCVRAGRLRNHAMESEARVSMRTIRQAARVCGYQLKIQRNNYKMYTLGICVAIYIWNAMEPLRTFLLQVDQKATPFLFPFLFEDAFLTALIFSGLFLFFTEAPFYRDEHLFVLIRVSRKAWALGHVLYVAAVSFFYMLFLALLSVLVLFPRVSFGNAWGKVWTTLALTDAAYELEMSFIPSAETIFRYTPLKAVRMVFVLGMLICMFYGFLIWCLNLYAGKTLSLILALSSAILVTRVRYMPSWVLYLVPASWAEIGAWPEVSLSGLSLVRIREILIIGNLAAAFGAYRKTCREDIAK